MAICASVFSGCANKEAEVEVIPETVCIYSYGEELENRMQYVLEAHPDWQGKIEFVTLSEAEYDLTLNKCFYPEEKKGKKDETEQEQPPLKYPDIFLTDAKHLPQYAASDKVLSMEELGITGDILDQMYDWSLKSATIEDSGIMALTWRVSPEAFIYKKSMASEYLGADERRDVQAYVKDQLTLDDSLLAIKKAAGRDIRVLDDASMYETESMRSNIFGFYADVDWLTKVFKDDKKLTLSETWGVCKGYKPEVTRADEWLLVTKDCVNKDFTSDVLKALCLDESILKKINEETYDFVNNKKVMSNAFHTSKGKLEVLGNEDYIEVFDRQVSRSIPEVPLSGDADMKEDADGE